MRLPNPAVLALLVTVGCASSPSRDRSTASPATLTSEPSAPARNESALPRTPSREAVMQAMSSANERMLACGLQFAGPPEIAASVLFASSGEALEAEVRDWCGSPAARDCMLDALRAIRVAPFARETFRVNYPYRLRRR